MLCATFHGIRATYHHRFILHVRKLKHWDSQKVNVLVPVTNSHIISPPITLYFQLIFFISIEIHICIFGMLYFQIHVIFSKCKNLNPWRVIFTFNKLNAKLVVYFWNTQRHTTLSISILQSACEADMLTYRLTVALVIKPQPSCLDHKQNGSPHKTYSNVYYYSFKRRKNLLH